MKEVGEFTRADLPNRVLACPRCEQTCLFSTDWKGNVTTFWAYGMDRLNETLFNDPAEWKSLIGSIPVEGRIVRYGERRRLSVR